MFDLTGKTALVTGASGGIGKAIAMGLHAAGATVGLSGTRRDALEALATSGRRSKRLEASSLLERRPDVASASNASRLVPESPTVAPAACRPMAIALPMPPLAPVTSAVFPVKSNINFAPNDDYILGDQSALLRNA